MNFLEQLKNQIAAGLNPLSAQIGAGETATRTAVNTGVPALFAALSGLASSQDGAQKIASAMGRFDASTVGNLLSDKPGNVIEQGTNILGSLFNQNIISGILNAISRFTGLNAASAQKLLAYLAPMVLGSIAGRFTGRQPTPQGLTSFFNEERQNITNAMPAGFSLADIPGMPNVGSVLRPGDAGMTPPSESGSPVKWLVPALAVAAAAVVLFFVFRGPTLSVPTPAKLTTDIGDATKSLTTTVSNIKDEASAESAARELKKMEATLDGYKAQLKKMPEADRGQVMEQAKVNLAKMEEQYARVVWAPGFNDKVRQSMDSVMTQMAAMAGEPAPKSAMVSGEVARAVSTITETLNGIKDGPTATLAVTKLKEVEGKLEEAKSGFGKLSDSTRSAVAAMIKPAVEKLRQLADRVMAMPGVGEKVKPVVDAILAKLDGLTA